MRKNYAIHEIVNLKLLPFKHGKIRKMIKNGELDAVNVGTEKRLIWRISQYAIDVWWKSKV